ncbi:acyl-CoA synthetase family member 3, mitochondrial [Anoplophora glabripennis]|nr:acyl-CoA synthetase family member 3, mitochondrial [Anoplophora glabripennis]
MFILNRRNFLKRILSYVPWKETRTISNLPLFANAVNFSDRTALYDGAGSYTFGNIFARAAELSSSISSRLSGKTNERVLFLCSNDVNYVITLWAIWMSGQIAVPLSPLHPVKILQYYAQDTGCKLLITAPQHQEVMRKISKTTSTNLYVIEEGLQKFAGLNTTTPEDLRGKLPSDFKENSNALILYTSGTTGNPKGVVLSHKNLLVQTNTLLQAWKWSSEDVILHTLPLHHVHGTVNALFCPLQIGARTIMLPKFSTEEVWSHLLGTNETLSNVDVSVFMAVPTIYSKLIDYYEKNLKGKKEDVRNRLKSKVRLMVSGSAPLPVPLYEKWLEISGHRLLERYGMTEIGMALSNEYDSDRAPGYVGVPLPGVSVRLSETTNDIHNTLLECKNESGTISFNKKANKNTQGELLVKGGGVFKEYFNKPEATRKEFTEDGWFKTGDMCEYVPEKNKFRILGRTSVDIIKSGGYKISALQIETVLLAHPDIRECAVLGIKDEVWGEKIAAVVVLRNGAEVSLDKLRDWASDKMPKYALPSELKVVEDIPKNAMGKVNKKELAKSTF